MNHIHAKFVDFETIADRNCEILLENSTAVLTLMQRANVTIKSLGNLPVRILQEIFKNPENASIAIHDYKLSSSLLKACLVDHLIPLFNEPNQDNYQDFVEKTTLRLAQIYKEELESVALGAKEEDYGHIYKDLTLLENDTRIASEHRPRSTPLTAKDFAAIEQSVFGRALGSKEKVSPPKDPMALIKTNHGWTW
jgi:hypothetical protein